jgi:hypothetical protein
MLDVVRILVFPLLLAACGGFSDADKRAIKDVVSDQASALELCKEDAGDCNAAQMRALSRASYCTLAATLVRHGESGVDAGIACERQ